MISTIIIMISIVVIVIVIIIIIIIQLINPPVRPRPAEATEPLGRGAPDPKERLQT